MNKMVDVVKITPESFRTLYLRAEDGTILQTENGKRIIIRRIIPEEWEPVRVYDFERELNENKKEIFLVDRDFYKQIDKEFRKIIKQ